jgi:hypothetical protein
VAVATNGMRQVTPISTSVPMARGAARAPRLKQRWSRLSALPRSSWKRSRNRPFIPTSTPPDPRPPIPAPTTKTVHVGATDSSPRPAAMAKAATGRTTPRPSRPRRYPLASDPMTKRSAETR